MLIKTGEAEIIDVVNPDDIEDDNTREAALATALDKAKKHLEAKGDKEVKTSTEN